MSTSERAKPTWSSRNVLRLGLVSLFTDVSSEMILPLLPAFLTGVLGAGALTLGWIEGLADATASVLKLLSGRWADRMGRSRPLIIAGYALSTLARPLVSVAGAAWHVLAVRLLDRTGKGIRTSPRDSLIAASVESHERGAAFGLQRGMDHSGAVLGPLIAAGFLTFVSRDLRILFALAAIPGVIALLVLILGVRETRAAKSVSSREPSPGAAAAGFGAVARFLVPLGLFTLGNASDVFLLLKAGAVEASIQTLPLLWMGLHVVKALSSVPGGRLADRWGKRRTITLGWLVYAAVYAGFAFAETRTAVVGLFLVYGLYYGLTEGAERALVAELAPGTKLGTAFGWYYVTLGVLAMIASVLFGALWESVGSRAAFLTSASFALLAVVFLATLGRPRRSRASG